MPKIEENNKKKKNNSDANYGIEENPVDYLREITSANLQNIIAVNKDRASQVREIISRIKWRKDKVDVIEKIKYEISLCEDEKKDEVFHKKILELLEPIIIGVAERREKFYRINGILTYGINENEKLIHIHIVPDIKTSKLAFKEKKKILLEGFSQIADILRKKTEIERITAMSPLLARSPKFIMSLGFSSPLPVSESEWKENFIYEYQNNTPVGFSEITRADFLKRYLKE